VQRLMLQDHLDLRALREERVGVVDAEGIVHANVEPGHRRHLSTVLGIIELCWGDVGLLLSMPRQGLGNSAISSVATEEQLERWRIESGIPRWGREIDDRILPAEAGLDETHISFSKGCYPGQEPIARQRYRGKVNRKLRVLEIDGEATPGDELVLDGKKVGRITSAVPGLALGYVRVEVPNDAQLVLGAKPGFARLR